MRVYVNMRYKARMRLLMLTRRKIFGKCPNGAD